MQATHLCSPAFLLLIALGTIYSGAGCGDDGAADAGMQAVELGSGALEFSPLQDGQELLLVAGTQGGYHFVVNPRVRGILTGNPAVQGELGNPQTRFAVFREDGSQIDAMGPIYRLGYEPAEDGWFQLRSGRILQIDQQLVIDEGVIPAIYDEQVRLEVEIRDAKGARISDEVWVVPLRDTSPDAGLFIDAGIDAASSM